MRPLYLKLRGFKGIRAGMGLDEIELDLRKLPEGLISVGGENGAGKTTLLDNFHPYRLMPYKLRESDGWSPRAFSYYKQCFGRDALKELIWEMGGVTYKSMIMIDAERQAQECYLYVETASGAWVPYNDSVKDGKTSPYDQAIEEICGTPDMFFTSVFRGQKAKEITSYSRGDITAIVIELLNLDHIKEQGRKAGEVIKALDCLVDDIIKTKAPILQALDGRLVLTLDRDMWQAALESSASLVANLRDSLKKQENALHEVELAVAAETVSRRRLEEMRARDTELATEIRTCQTDSSSRLDDIDSDLRNVANELRSEEQAVAAQLHTIATKKTAAESIIARADEIREASDKEQELSTALTSARAVREGHVAKYQELSPKVKQSATAKAEVETARREIYAENERRQTRLSELAREKDRCQAQLHILAAGLDCKGDGSSSINESCPLILDAVKAKQRVAEIETEVTQLGDPSTKINGHPPLSDLETAAAALQAAWEKEYSTVEADLKACAEAGRESAAIIADLEKSLAETQKTAALIFELETAEELLTDLSEQTETTTARLKEKQTSLTTRREELERKRQETKDASDRKLTDLETRKAAGLRDIEVLANTLAGDSDKERGEIQVAIAGLVKEIGEAEAKEKELHGKLGAIAQQLHDLDEKEQALTGYDERISRINKEISAWKVLQLACSNNGIIQLAIDDSGPTISALTNDLLVACYGPRFSVRIETQAAKNDGGLKEVFDITVFDAERDEEKSIRDMSGGETTTIEDAVVRAFNLLNLNRDDREYLSVFSDEKDGALSPERKKEYLLVKRKAIELGRHAREFFITQTVELQDAADARIILRPGGISIA